jgi:hypothetical protein
MAQVLLTVLDYLRLCLVEELNFEPAETVKSVPLDPSSDASKQVRIGSELDPK